MHSVERHAKVGYELRYGHRIRNPAAYINKSLLQSVHKSLFVCFVFYVPSTIFQLNRDESSGLN